MAVSIEAVPLGKPDDVNVIVGQAHFIKTMNGELQVASARFRWPLGCQ